MCSGGILAAIEKLWRVRRFVPRGGGLGKEGLVRGKLYLGVWIRVRAITSSLGLGAGCSVCFPRRGRGGMV